MLQLAILPSLPCYRPVATADAIHMSAAHAPHALQHHTLYAVKVTVPSLALRKACLQEHSLQALQEHSLALLLPSHVPT